MYGARVARRRLGRWRIYKVQALRLLTGNKKVDRATALLTLAIFDVAMPDFD